MQNDRDHLSRNDLTGGRNRESNTGVIILGTLAVLAVLAALFIWAPWNHNANSAKNGSGPTVGSSTRPATPAAPTGTHDHHSGCALNRAIGLQKDRWFSSGSFLLPCGLVGSCQGLARNLKTVMRCGMPHSSAPGAAVQIIYPLGIGTARGYSASWL